MGLARLQAVSMREQTLGNVRGIRAFGAAPTIIELKEAYLAITVQGYQAEWSGEPEILFHAGKGIRRG